MQHFTNIEKKQFFPFRFIASAFRLSLPWNVLRSFFFWPIDFQIKSTPFPPHEICLTWIASIVWLNMITTAYSWSGCKSGRNNLSCCSRNRIVWPQQTGDTCNRWWHGLRPQQQRRQRLHVAQIKHWKW